MGHREDTMGSVNSGRRLLELLIRHLAKDRICKRIISWAEDAARQWSACLASTGFKPPALHVLGLVARACNLSAWEGEAGKSEVQGHPQKTTTKQHPLCLSVKSLVGRPEGYSKYRPKQNVFKIVFYYNVVTTVIFIQRAPNYLTLHVPDT